MSKHNKQSLALVVDVAVGALGARVLLFYFLDKTFCLNLPPLEADRTTKTGAEKCDDDDDEPRSVFVLARSID